MKSLFQNWWLVLLQGVVLFVLGILVMSHPDNSLSVLSFWLGILVGITGVLILLEFFISEERYPGKLAWGLVTLVVGILFMAQVDFAKNLIVLVVGLWLIFTGVWLAWSGSLQWSLGYFVWFLLFAGIASILVGLAAAFNVHTGALVLSVLLGVQFVISGLALVVMAFMKRRLLKQIQP